MAIRNPSIQSVLAFSLLQIFLGQLGIIWITIFSGGRHRSWSVIIPILATANGFFGIYSVLTRKKTCAVALIISSLAICALNIPLAIISRNVACFGKDCGKLETPTLLSEDWVNSVTGLLILVPFVFSIGFLNSLYRFAMKPHINDAIDEDELAKEQAYQMHLLFEESSRAFDEENVDEREKNQLEIVNSRKPSTSSFSVERNSSFGSSFDCESDGEELEEKPLMSKQH